MVDIQLLGLGVLLNIFIDVLISQSTSFLFKECQLTEFSSSVIGFVILIIGK